MIRKETGSYYTPDALADFVLNKVVFRFKNTSERVDVLEPSCGDGSFLRALSRLAGRVRYYVDAVDISADAIELAKSNDYSQIHPAFFNCDFLGFQPKRKYKLCIGNPPYVRRKLIAPSQREVGRSIHAAAGLKDHSLNNIWTAFVIRATQALDVEGVLAFVLPAELLQVKFAQEIQSFLKRHFQRIEIYSFKEMLFQGLGQDIVVVIAFKASSDRGVYFGHVEKLTDREQTAVVLTRSKSVETSGIKWAAHILSDYDASFLLDVASRFKSVRHFCSSSTGIVTAANGFFIVSEAVRDEFELATVARPIVQRGQFVVGAITFNHDDFRRLVTEGKPCYLLDTNGVRLKELGGKALSYLKRGKTLGIQNRFKCTTRDRWYDVPDVWSSEAFFFKRSHLYPKLILNRADVLVTDSAYRVRVLGGYNAMGVVFSFYNSLTFAMAELFGRFYGGGVLELTPNEFKALPLPYVLVDTARFNSFESMFNKKDGIRQCLDSNDYVVLHETFAVTEKEIIRLQAIRHQLVQRRLRK